MLTRCNSLPPLSAPPHFFSSNQTRTRYHRSPRTCARRHWRHSALYHPSTARDSDGIFARAADHVCCPPARCGRGRGRGAVAQWLRGGRRVALSCRYSRSDRSGSSDGCPTRTRACGSAATRTVRTNCCISAIAGFHELREGALPHFSFGGSSCRFAPRVAGSAPYRATLRGLVLCTQAGTVRARRRKSLSISCFSH